MRGRERKGREVESPREATRLYGGRSSAEGACSCRSARAGPRPDTAAREPGGIGRETTDPLVAMKGERKRRGREKRGKERVQNYTWEYYYLISRIGKSRDERGEEAGEER